MKLLRKPSFPKWLFAIHPQVWILAIGRFLSEVGTGFTLFYAPIFFVNQVGLSATEVGFALGTGSVAGIFGRILGGSLTDSPQCGRRRTLLLATGIAAIGSSVLATTYSFITLIIGNLIYGFATGLYWPSTEAVVADLTVNSNRRLSFAITRLADNLGMGMGIVLAGIVISTTNNYRLLFTADAISFLVFFVVIWIAISETLVVEDKKSEQGQYLNAWVTALQNRQLCIFVVVNIIFTTYISQLHSTLPLYFKNSVNIQGAKSIFSESDISALFAWHLVVAIFAQLPVARILNRFSHTQALTVSACFWALGFGLVWQTGALVSKEMAIAALGVFAIAIVSYTPYAVALVSDLAPASQRGVYLSINSLCWACGYFIGPILGGWVLDNGVIETYWISLAFSVIITIMILQYLQKMRS
ncbi:Major facilitator superfamily MFS_1 [Rivularia sp. IAM M-261]|nr:Major facilitator superfamily MFS_1 [Calothrix sp. PCC 7716]GJD18274.1 Major facilitator superfamily MFS_1 [Rivularia sp. IAM M-261]